MTPNPIKELATFFDSQYQEHVGSRYPFNNGKDAKLLKELRAIYSDEDIRLFMAAFFDLEDDFVQNSGFSLGAFRGCLPKVIQHVKRHQVKADIRGHVPPCKTNAECLAKVFASARKAKAETA